MGATEQYIPIQLSDTDMTPSTRDAPVSEMITAHISHFSSVVLLRAADSSKYSGCISGSCFGTASAATDFFVVVSEITSAIDESDTMTICRKSPHESSEGREHQGLVQHRGSPVETHRSEALQFALST